MTLGQRHRYFRAWNSAWKAHWAGVSGGQVLARQDRPASEIRDQVVAIAGRLAGASPLTPDLIRHACHMLALGRDVASGSLSNKEQDLVIALFDRLAEQGREVAGQMRMDARSTELGRQASVTADASQACGAAIPWEGRRPDADRKRVTWALNHSGYPEAAIATIAADKFGTSNWRALDDARLYQLMITVKARAAVQNSKRRRAAAQPPSTCRPAATLVLQAA